MKSEIIRIRYDGPALDGHAMDVNHLAPALLALGDICSLANEKFNPDRVTIKVLVRADIEAKCFDFGFEIVQTIYTQAQALITQEEVKNAKELLSWLGIIKGEVFGTCVGLFACYKWLKGRTISEKKMITKDGRKLIQLSVVGDNKKINITPETAELLEDPKYLEGIQQIIEPLLKEGYETLEFEHNQEVTEKITKEEAFQMSNIQPADIDENEIKGEPQEFTALLKVYQPIVHPDKPKWKFDIGDKNIQTVDISETSIAADMVESGFLALRNIYKVRLELTQTITKNNNILDSYKVKKVLEIIPGKPSSQGRLFPGES